MLPIVLKNYVWICHSLERRTFSAFFIYFFLPPSYARLPTLPQAQQDALVLTMPAPQGSRVACWVPHFSTGIPVNAVGLPQECLPTTASVTGKNREQERESEEGNTLIESEQPQMSHSHPDLDLFVPIEYHFSSNKSKRRSYVVFVTTHHRKWASNESYHHLAVRPRVMKAWLPFKWES